MKIIKKNININTKNHLPNKQLFYKKYESAVKNSRPCSEPQKNHSVMDGQISNQDPRVEQEPKIEPTAETNIVPGQSRGLF